MRPSNSTFASVGIGVPAATVISWTVSLFGVVMPGPVEAAIGAIISSVIGYFFLGGKAVEPVDSTTKESP
jgi:hypothetical protein